MTFTTQEFEAMFPPDIQKTLIDIMKYVDLEQKPLREYHLKEYKKNDFYWNTLQNIFWSETSKDYRPYEDGMSANPQLDVDEDDIGRVINIVRAYGESIIAGLSAAVPAINFAPDDADNVDDNSTAKAYGKISNLINIHNNAQVKLIKALFILFNQSFVACYNYYDTSDKYGTYKKPVTIPQTLMMPESSCPLCGDQMQEDQSYCPLCDQNVQPDIQVIPQEVLIASSEDCPKSRELIEFYGPMNVKIPFYAFSQQTCPYLILQAEYHMSIAKDKFPWIADKIKSSKVMTDYEKWARQPSEAYMNPDTDIVTITRMWLRPSAYWMIEDEAKRNEMMDSYPNGCYSAYVDDVFAEAHDEDLDEHWTISENPLSIYLHAPPMVRPLIDVQDMTNDMYNITLRTIQYGIPLTFVDADVIDLDKFKETPTEPGMVVPIKGKQGQNVSGSFHTVSMATLGQEVDNFTIKLEQAGQLVSGAFPSIYGGTMQGGGKTFKEYDASRSQALQRLGTTWKMVNIWWKDWMTKACKEYTKNLEYDDHYTQKSGASYVNIWIKRAELQGKIGDVEAETSDQFPQTINQQRGLLLDLIQMQNPEINTALFHPENVGMLTRVLGFNQFYIPGDDQRNKQLRENIELMTGQPMQQAETDPKTGLPTANLITVSSVPIEPLDDDSVHMSSIVAFIISDQGQYIKDTNPIAYQNLMLHWQEHANRYQQQQQQQMMQQLQMQQMQQDNKYVPNKVNYNVSDVESGKA